MDPKTQISYSTRPLHYYYGTGVTPPRDFEQNLCPEHERFNRDVVPLWLQDDGCFSKRKFVAWMKAAGVLEWLGNFDTDVGHGVADRIEELFKPWFSQFPVMDTAFGRIHLCFRGRKGSDPPVLFSKLCKEGRCLKIGINMSQTLGLGASRAALLFPVLKFTKDAEGHLDFDVKPKVLLRPRTMHLNHLFRMVKGAEESSVLHRQVLEKDRYSLIAPLPRRLANIPGLYIQRYFPRDLFGVKDCLSQETKLIALERMARAAALLEQCKVSHFDFRPTNILMTTDHQSSLNDFGGAGSFGDSYEVTKEFFPYRGVRFHKARINDENFVLTKGVDLVGLARTIAETFFQDISDETPHDDWWNLWESKQEDFKNNYDPVQVEVFSQVILPIIRADKDFDNDLSDRPTKEEIEEKANKHFSSVNATWVADKLKAIHHKHFSQPLDDESASAVASPVASGVFRSLGGCLSEMDT